MRATCTEEFRQVVLDIYPGLNKDPTYWNLMRRLLFSQKKDKVTGEVILDYVSLAKDEFKIHLVDNCHYNALNFLEKFKKDVILDLKWSDFSFVDSKARNAIIK